MNNINPTHFTEDDYYSQISMFATDDTIGRFLARAKRKEYTGLCLHCGTPCAPYSTCKKCRDYATIGRVLREEIAAGRVEEVGREVHRKIYKKTEEGQRYYAALAFKQKQDDARGKVFHKDSKSRKRAKLARKARRVNHAG